MLGNYIHNNKDLGHQLALDVRMGKPLQSFIEVEVEGVTIGKLA